MEKIFYLAQILGGLNTVSIVLLVCSFILLITALISWGLASCDYDEDAVKVSKKLMKPAIIGIIIGALLNIFVPSKETFLFMVGGKVVDSTIANKPEIKELPENTLNLLNEYIKTATEQLKTKDD